MRPSRSVRVLLIHAFVGAAGLCASVVALADDKFDADEILSAVRRGEAMPLARIERDLAGTFPGEIVKVEIEREEGRLIYEFKTIDAQGRRADVYVDAKSGAVLRVKRK